MTLKNTSDGTGGFLPHDFGALVEKPLRAAAVAFDPNVAGQIYTESATFDIPVVDSDAGAAFVAEGNDIQIEDAVFDTVSVTPAKVAGISVISRELSEDSSPEAGQVVANGLAFSIARKVDQALFAGLPSPAPAGLATADVHEMDWDATSLDSILEAYGFMRDLGANPTAVVVSGSDLTDLSKLKDGTGSLRGLLEPDATMPTRFLVNGVPLISSPAVPAGTAYVLDSTKLFTVLRSGTTVELDTSVYFVSDRVAVKARARVGFGIAHPEALVRLVQAGS
ncbi:phage major capsid protein [Gordonia hongkongensis]|uniref:phage major capsid protein n=1 Tax=Gordonia hongkongensis TaxID=1701090 RepID=UPI003D70271D